MTSAVLLCYPLLFVVSFPMSRGWPGVRIRLLPSPRCWDCFRLADWVSVLLFLSIRPSAGAATIIPSPLTSSLLPSTYFPSSMLSILLEYESNTGLALVIPFLFQPLGTIISMHPDLFFYWLCWGNLQTLFHMWEDLNMAEKQSLTLITASQNLFSSCPLVLIC